MEKRMDDLKTNDVFQTSHGVGHHWRSRFYFPSHEEKAHLGENLPPTLDKPCELTSQAHFKTTYQYFHDRKDNAEPFKQEPLHNMAPSLEKVNYLKDYRFVSNRRPWRRSLSPRNQLSETHEAFKPPEPLSEPKDLLGIKDFLLHEYDPHEFNKEKLAENIEDKWGGGNLPPLGLEVMRQLDPYLTTNLKTHRSWHPEELNGYPKKDILTHWETNKTPKAWGYGLKNNPVTEENVPRQQFPMRDELKFKFETTIRRIPPPPVTVPHSGFKTLHMESYDGSSTALAKAARVCPVDTPYVLPDPGTVAPLTAPLMYKTEYNTYGDCHRTLL